jgi:hypothetical protein
LASQTATNRGSGLLPVQFADLERFVEDWALPTQSERHRRRLSSSIDALREFYEAIVGKMDGIIAYLNQFPVEKQPDDARTLFLLTMSLAEIAMAVELFKQPAVVDGFDPRRFKANDVPHMTPHLEKTT